MVRSNNNTASVRLNLFGRIIEANQAGQISPLDVYLSLTSGENVLTMVSDSPAILVDDPRTIVFGLFNPQVKEIN